MFQDIEHATKLKIIELKGNEKEEEYCLTLTERVNLRELFSCWGS